MNNKSHGKTKIKSKELNELKDEEMIKLLKEDLKLIKKIKNPSLIIQKMVVKEDIEYFKFIKTPHLEIIEYVAKLKPSLLKDDMLNIESVQNILIDSNPLYAKSFKTVSETMKEKIAQKIPSILNYENNENLQRIAFEKSSLAYKYFKECALISDEEVMKNNPGLFIYIKDVDKKLIANNITDIPYLLFGYIREYTKEMLEYILLNSSYGITYLNYEKMMKVEDIDSLEVNSSSSIHEHVFYNMPYRLCKRYVSKIPNLCKIVVFGNEDEILEAINSNKKAIVYLKNISEDILNNISENLYSKIDYFGKVSVETQRKLLERKVSYAGKIENVDLDLAKEFCVYDDSIIRYLRCMDDELRNYGISNGIINFNEFTNLDKGDLVNSMFLLNRFMEEDDVNVVR